MTNTKSEFRAYRDEQDLLRMRAYLVDDYLRDDRWHVGDLVWQFFLLSIGYDACENIRLWERDGEVLGFAIYNPRDTSIGWQLALRDVACEDELFDWAKARYRQLGGQRGRLLSGALQTDVYNRELLKRQGFRCTGHGYCMNVLDLTTWRAPQDPSRITVRSVAGEEECAARAQAHREAFHPSRVTDESYSRLMRLPGYIRDLDLVAVAPDGQFGAFCIVWEDAQNRVGEFEPVGTRPVYRRRGMARAVLVEGLRRLQARGCATAIVWTECDNAAARALYESVGFHMIKQDDNYEYRDR